MFVMESPNNLPSIGSLVKAICNIYSASLYDGTVLSKLVEPVLYAKKEDTGIIVGYALDETTPVVNWSRGTANQSCLTEMKDIEVLKNEVMCGCRRWTVGMSATNSSVYIQYNMDGVSGSLEFFEYSLNELISLNKMFEQQIKLLKLQEKVIKQQRDEAKKLKMKGKQNGAI